MDSAIDDSDTEPAELGAENVGAVARGIHQSFVRKLESPCDRQILTGCPEGIARVVYPVEGGFPLGGIVRKISSREHVDRVAPRDRSHLVIGADGREICSATL